MDWAYPIRVSASKYPDRTAILFRGDRWTYEELDRRVDALADALRRRGLAGERVASILLNEPSTLCLYLACARIGAVTVPVNARLVEREIRFVVEHSGASLLVADADYLDIALRLQQEVESLEHVVSVNAPNRPELSLEDLLGTSAPADVTAGVSEADPAMIIYTSGTTGFPKGVVRSHGANLWNTVNSFIGSPRTKEDVELFTLPIFGLGLLHFAMPVLVAGAALVLDRVFDAKRTWQLLEEHRATRTFLAPTMMDSLLAVDGHERHDVSSLTTIYSAYEFPAPVRARALERFGDRFVYMYGLTEAQLTAAEPGEFAAEPTSAGKPMGLMRVRIVDGSGNPLPRGEVGEITLEGPALMSEYYSAPEATADALRGGWLHTGDLGYLDAAGNLHMTGRKKEIIKTGGFNVDPVEVETAIYELPGVREAAVVGVPDDHWGERVVAFVAGDVAGDAVVDHCKQRLAGYKAPKEVVLVAELPKNPTGKVQRGELRKMWKGGADASSAVP